MDNGGHFIGQTFLWNIYPSGFDFSYTPFAGPAGQSFNGGTPVITNSHSILNNITVGSVSGPVNTVSTLSSNSTLVLSYPDNTPLLGVQQVNTSRRVGINAYGAPNYSDPIGKMMGNGVLWCLNII